MELIKGGGIVLLYEKDMERSETIMLYFKKINGLK